MRRFEVDFLDEYTDEALIAELRRIAALLQPGQPLTQTEYKRLSGRASRVMFLRRFGGWKQALEKAGLQHLQGRYPQVTSQITDAQCFENLALLWTHYGRQPQYREMFRGPSAIQGKTYITRWGTWRKALKAFVEWANAADRPKEPVSTKQGTGTYPSTPDSKPDRTEADCREVRPRLQFQVFKRDHFRCVYCGRSPATHLGVVLHADHFLAVKNGGKTTLDNLQTLCDKCNLGKGTSIVS